MIVPAARLLVGLAATLAVLLALEWALPGRAAPEGVVPLARLRPAAQAAALPARQAVVWAGAVLARPVFSISRRPPRVTVKGPAEVAAGQARLSGIMITRSGRRAIFAPEGGGHALVLPEGASVNQSTIRSILPDRVVLAGGAVLRPSYDRNRPTATTPSSFQPVVPAFNPVFPNTNFPGTGGVFGNNPNFGAPGFVQPQVQPRVIQPEPGDNDDVVQRPVVPPIFRGTTIPPRRE